jgi:hypothetical protein
MAGQKSNPRSSFKRMETLPFGVDRVCGGGTGVTPAPLRQAELAASRTCGKPNLRQAELAASETRVAARLGYFRGLAALIGRFEHAVDGWNDQLAASQADDSAPR